MPEGNLIMDELAHESDYFRENNRSLNYDIDIDIDIDIEIEVDLDEEILLALK